MTRRSWWLLALLIAVLALAASANSIANGFTYDDVYVIVRDARSHSLTRWWNEFRGTYWAMAYGGDGYRPLTRLLFRMEWVAGGGSPLLFHATNVALHVAGSIAVFWLASTILPVAAAWVAAALYAVHPVHVEATANIVGQSELTVALIVALAVAIYVSGRRQGPITWRRWVAIGALYAAGCLFKEHAIVLPALLILAEATVVSDRAPLRQRMEALRLPSLVLAVIAVAYLWARTRVVRSFTGFVPVVVFRVLGLDTADRLLTMVGASTEWLRLLLWPAHLMTDYAPPYIDIATGPSVMQIPGLLVLVGTIGLAAACWRRSPVTAFGLGWLIITLLPASNFIVPAGIIVAERTLFLPSIGAMIAIGSAIPWLYERVEKRPIAQFAAAALVVALIGLGVGRSVTRNRVWHDNETLLRQGVKDAPESYRAHFLLGTFLFENLRKREAEAHYRRALQLFPYDPMLIFALADQYRQGGMCAPAMPLYRYAFQIDSMFRRGAVGLAGCLLETGQLEEAKRMALASIRWGGNYITARDIIRAADARRDSIARLGRPDSAARQTVTKPPPPPR